MSVEELIETIIGCAKKVRSQLCAKKVRSQLTPGFEERVYKNAMFKELRDCGIEVETEVPFNVYYKKHIVGSYKADNA